MDNWNALAETALRPASQSPQLMTLVFVFVLKWILHLVPSKIHTSKYLYHQWPTPEPLCSTYSHHDINITQTKLGVKRDFGLLQFFSFCLDKKRCICQNSNKYDETPSTLMTPKIPHFWQSSYAQYSRVKCKRPHQLLILSGNFHSQPSLRLFVVKLKEVWLMDIF